MEVKMHNRPKMYRKRFEKITKEFDPVAIGQRIARIRKNAGLSQRAFSEIIGISHVTICLYERGIHAWPLRLIFLIALLFQKKADVILGLSLKRDILLRKKKLEKERNINKMYEDKLKMLKGG